MRTHKDFIKKAKQVQLAHNQTAANRLGTEYGINGVPILSYLPSISILWSFGYDFMHLMWENVFKNLLLLWTGDFKDVDEGNGSYKFAEGVWDAIGEATSHSASFIPGAFGSRQPNIASEKYATTAETNAFWMSYLGPVLLARKFQREVYYKHFVELVKLVNLCVRFELPSSQVAVIREGFKEWVMKFEECVSFAMTANLSDYHTDCTTSSSPADCPHALSRSMHCSMSLTLSRSRAQFGHTGHL
jgi:hypothetical protein